MAALGEPDDFKEFRCSGPACAFIYSGELERDFNVFLRSEVSEKEKILKNEVLNSS